MKLFLWFSNTVLAHNVEIRPFLDWFLNNVSALQIGMYNFSQTVLFSFLGGPFRQVGGLCHGCLRSWARAPRCSELYAQCQLSIFFWLYKTLSSTVTDLYSLPGSTSTFFCCCCCCFQRQLSTLIVKTFEDGDGDSLKVNEKCVKNDDTKKKNNKSAQ